MMRLSQAAKILNVGHTTLLERLSVKGFKVESNPNAKLNGEHLDYLAKEFKSDELSGGGTKKPESHAPIVEAKISNSDDEIGWFRPSATPVATPPTVAAPAAPIVAAPVVSAPSAPVAPQPIVVAPAPVAVSPTVDVAPAVDAAKVETAKVDAAKVDAPTVETSKPVEVVAAPVAPKPTAEAKLPEPPQAVVVPPVVETKPELKTEVKEEPKAEVPKAETTAPTPEPKSEAIVEVPAPKAEVKEVAVAKEPEAKQAEQAAAPAETVKIEAKLPGITILGKIDLTPQKPVSSKPQGGGRDQSGRNTNRRPDAQPQRSQPVDARPERPANDRNKLYDRNRDTPPPARVVTEPVVEEVVELIEAKADQLKGLTVLGRIELPVEKPRGKSAAAMSEEERKKKRKRVRIKEKVTGPNTTTTTAPANRDNRDARPAGRDGQRDNRPATGAPAAPGTSAPATAGGARPAGTQNASAGGGARGKDNKRRDRRDEPTQSDIKDSIKATEARLRGGKANFGAKARKQKRMDRAEVNEQRLRDEEVESKILKVSEFVSANDLASLMDVPVQEIIATCMNMGMFVSINQRLDAEAIAILADEFGYEVQFVSAEEEIEAGFDDDDDLPEDKVERAPIVTIMGHVDHGKTSLLDYIRRTRVAAGEAGGITQHIGAYSVNTDSGRKIAFLDTPGHEAFTAMRARGAKVTDCAVIVIAADDSIMPQTREAINHAQVAGVPIVFAFSKVDKAGANTEKIREELSQMNILVEDWGGKFQSQEISSKSGMGISDLLEKVLLETDMLELRANEKRKASGTVIEAMLDKGRGYVATILVQNGSLNVGDVVLAGAHYGRIRAMFNSRGEKVKTAGPSTPVQVLGLSGAPQAGDRFNVMDTDREAREIANKREQILREQSIRTRRHITLEEIGRRKAIGTFKELNLIVKGDVDGSVEALSDSLLKLSTEEVQVNIIHKAVGQISESDVNLAIASDAIIVGFQVRPSVNAKKMAEAEQIDVRLYSIIYDAINEVKDAMQGMLEPTVEETITGNIEIREVFKISKIGTVAGCYVLDGTVKRNNKIRIIRDFIVVHTGEISALKRFKDDVADVRAGFECGLSIKNYNDIQVGDIIESFELKEVKRSL